MVNFTQIHLKYLKVEKVSVNTTVFATTSAATTALITSFTTVATSPELFG
jgi:hypothetical protein